MSICKVVVATKDFKKTELNPNVVGEVDGDLSYSDIAKMILNKSDSEKNSLIELILNSSTISITDLILKGRNVPSNTTLSEIGKRYPSLQEIIELLPTDITQGYNILTCSNFKINGCEHYGRVVQPDGSELFLIKNFDTAKLFINYLETLAAIKKNFKEGLVSENLKPLQEELKTHCDHYNKSPYALIKDYLDHKNKYKFYKKDGKTYFPGTFLNKVIKIINNDYNPDTEKSELLATIDNIAKKSERFLKEIDCAKLYEILKEFGLIDISKSDFLKLTNEELNTLLLDAFMQDLDLRNFYIPIISESEDEIIEDITHELLVGVKLQKIAKSIAETVWKEVKKANSDKDIKYSAFETALQDASLHGLLLSTLKEQLSKNHKNVLISISQNDKGKYVISITEEVPDVPKEKVKSRTITLKSKYKTWGDLYGFGYESQYLIKPVNEGDVNNGEYNGMFIYEYFNKDTNTTEYMVSDNFINSKETSAQRFYTLAAAKLKIDERNLYTPIIKADKHSLHTETKRTITLPEGFKHVNAGLLLTYIDFLHDSMGNLKTIPREIADLWYGTVYNFQLKFADSGIEGIDKLNTPEMAGIFLHKYVEKIRELNRLVRELHSNEVQQIKEINDALRYAESLGLNNDKYSRLKASKLEYDIFDFKEFNKTYQEYLLNLVNQILVAPKTSYMVESVSGSTRQIITVVSTKDNGNDIKVTGKYDGDVPANKPLITRLDDMAKYFNENFGIQTEMMSNDELADYMADNNINEDVKNVRAFVHNGTIIINKSKANILDYVHELSHIVLGIVRVNNQSLYNQIIQKEANSIEGKKYLGVIKDKYKNFALEDLLEELAVYTISKRLYGSDKLKRYAQGNEEIADDTIQILENIINDALRIMELYLIPLDSEMKLFDFIKEQLSEKNAQVNKNMQLSYLILSKIKDGSIIKSLDC